MSFWLHIFHVNQLFYKCWKCCERLTTYFMGFISASKAVRLSLLEFIFICINILCYYFICTILIFEANQLNSFIFCSHLLAMDFMRSPGLHCVTDSTHSRHTGTTDFNHYPNFEIWGGFYCTCMSCLHIWLNCWSHVPEQTPHSDSCNTCKIERKMKLICKNAPSQSKTRPLQNATYPLGHHITYEMVVFFKRRRERQNRENPT